MLDWFLKYWLGVGFGLICSVVTYLFNKVRTINKQNKEDNQSIKNALKSILHNILMNECQSIIDKKYCTNEDFERVLEYYTPYKSLGGNGSAKRMVEQIQSLPATPNT